MSNVNKKQIQLLKKGKDLFWKYGIKRVTVEEICAEADVSKMTFYKYFKNKADLARVILENLIDDAFERFHDIMASEVPFEKKLTKFILLNLEGSTYISKEYINDFASIDLPELSSLIERIRTLSVDMVMDDLIAAQKRGEIRQDIRPEFINFFINHMMTLVNDPVLSELYPDGQSIVMELVRFLFYGIMPHNPEPGNE